MAKATKALEELKKLYGKQSDLNKQVLAAQKAYSAALKEDAGSKKPGRKPSAKKPAVKRAAKKRVSKKPATPVV